MRPNFLKVATPDSHASPTFSQTTDAFLRFWPANNDDKNLGADVISALFALSIPRPAFQEETDSKTHL